MLLKSPVSMNPTKAVLDLVREWEDARYEELDANLRRLNIETQLCELLSAPEEGQKSHRVGDYKVVRTNKFYYKGAADLLLPLAAELELDIPIKQEVSESALRKLYKSARTSFDIMESEGAIKRTLGKPSFEISRVVTV